MTLTIVGIVGIVQFAPRDREITRVEVGRPHHAAARPTLLQPATREIALYDDANETPTVSRGGGTPRAARFEACF